MYCCVSKSLFDNIFSKGREQKKESFSSAHVRTLKLIHLLESFLTKLKGQTILLVAHLWLPRVNEIFTSGSANNKFQQSVGGIWEQNLGLPFFA